MGSILWGLHMGINTFPKSLEELNYANFNVISHCETHRGHQENQRDSFSSRNFSRKRLCKQFHAELGGQGNPDSPCPVGQTSDSQKIQTENTNRIQIPDSRKVQA